MSITTKENDERAYAFTYRKNYKKGANMLESDYDKIFYNLQDTGIKISEYVFETSTKQPQLHLHGIFYSSPKNIKPSKLYVAGYYYKVEELYNKEGWEKYIRKTKNKEIKQENFFNKHLKKDICTFTHPDIISDDDYIDDVYCKPPTKKLFK